MARRKRSDSIDHQVETIRRVLDGAPPPPSFCTMEPKHMPFWKAIMDTKDYEMWTPNDLVVAAGLARIQCEIDEYAQMISKKSRLMKDGDTIAISPLHKIIVDLQSQQASMCRTLQIHARATHGESAHQSNRNATFHQARKKVKEPNNVMTLIKRA
jgi:hypothetical protein